MKPPKGVRKAVKAFLGVKKRDVSNWPDLDRPLGYKDRLRNSKENYGIETHGLKERMSEKHEDSNQRVILQNHQDQKWDNDSALGHEEDLYYNSADPRFEDRWEDRREFDPRTFPRKQDTKINTSDPSPSSSYRQNNSVYPGSSSSSAPDKIYHHQHHHQHQMDPEKPLIYDLHPPHTNHSSSIDSSVSRGNEIGERLMSCMSELDRLTHQLDTVVSLTEKIDQIRDEEYQVPEVETPTSVPYCNLPPKSNKDDTKEQEKDATIQNYHRGIIDTNPAPSEDYKMIARLPSKTPAKKQNVEDDERAYMSKNRRFYRLPEDQWSSSGYSSGSFESISPYQPYMQDPYATYGSVHNYPRNVDHYGSFYPADESSYNYGVYQPRKYMPTNEGWYYFSPPQVNSSDYYHQENIYHQYDGSQSYEDWVYSPYELESPYHGVKNNFSAEYRDSTSVDDSQQEKQLEGSKPPEWKGFEPFKYQKEQPSLNNPRTVSTDSTGKRKTVRFSKTVQERQLDKDETKSSAMKGSTEDINTKQREMTIYEFPEGHIESSCMCEDCILARQSVDRLASRDYTY